MKSAFEASGTSPTDSTPISAAHDFNTTPPTLADRIEQTATRSHRRRTLEETAGTLLGVFALPDAVAWARSRKGGRICLGGPIFLDSNDPGALAREHRRLGYCAAYVPKVELHDADRIKAIVKEIAAQDVVIAESVLGST